MPLPPDKFVPGRHREWVMILSGERIASVRTLGAFLDAVGSDALGIAPQIQRVRALYLITEADGALRAACCFTLGFDPRGRIPTRFDLPLRVLALESGDGPVFGPGPVRVAHRGQCVLRDYEELLWGRSGSELRAWLDAAQQLLMGRLRARGQGRRVDRRNAPAPNSDPRVVDIAERRAEKAFASTRDDGRRLVGSPTATGEQHAIAIGQIWSREQVEALKARHRNEIAVLKQEIELLRRRLRAAETPEP